MGVRFYAKPHLEIITVSDVRLVDNTTSAYSLILDSDSDGTALDANRTLIFDVNNANRTIDLSGNLTLSGANQVAAWTVDTTLTMGAASHLVLPLHDDAVTPTLAFGDGDTGFYEASDDSFRIAVGGAVKWIIYADLLCGVASFAGSLVNEISSATNPVFVLKDDDDTGIGRAAADQLSLIAGGVEGIRIKEDTTIDVAVFGNLTRKFTVTTDNTNGAYTHLVAVMLGGLVRRGTGDEITAAATDVTDTAANIVGAIPGCIVGSGFEFSIANEDSTHTVALDGGTGVTIVPSDPSTAIPANSTGRFLVVVTNATAASEAVSVHALGYSTH